MVKVNDKKFKLIQSAMRNNSGVEDVSIKLSSNGQTTSAQLYITLKSGARIELWGIAEDNDKDIFYENITAMSELSPKDISEINVINNKLKSMGVKNVPKFKSINKKQIVTEETIKGDKIDYVYKGGLTMMPEKTGGKSGWTGTQEFYIDVKGEKTDQLDMTKSVMASLKSDGFDFDGAKNEDEYYDIHDRLQHKIIEDKAYWKYLQDLAKKDFKEAKK